MDALVAVEKIEGLFGFKLPSGYRAFLEQSPEDVIESVEIDALESWSRGPIATVDRLYSSATILENDAAQASCDPEQKMLIIGHSVFGGYLYLCWAVDRLGQVFFREPFHDGSYYLVAGSFEEFLARRRPVVYDDEA